MSLASDISNRYLRMREIERALDTLGCIVTKHNNCCDPGDEYFSVKYHNERCDLTYDIEVVFSEIWALIGPIERRLAAEWLEHSKAIGEQGISIDKVRSTDARQAINRMQSFAATQGDESCVS